MRIKSIKVKSCKRCRTTCKYNVNYRRDSNALWERIIQP